MNANRQTAPRRWQLAFALAALMACDAGIDVGSSSQAIESENALSMNALSMNALSMNALSMNALSMNALSMNALSMNGLLDDSDGRHLLKYIVRCALAAGESYTVSDSASISYTFEGMLGLLPAWTERALTPPETEALSACLLAHVNAYGISISISARHPSLPITQGEVDRFSVFEGAFFGQVFGATPALYSCTGAKAPNFSDDNPKRSAGDRLLRRCTDPDGSSSVCGFERVGSCASVCTIAPTGEASSCSSGGATYGEAVSIWLVESEDPASTMDDDLYDVLWGD